MVRFRAVLLGVALVVSGVARAEEEKSKTSDPTIEAAKKTYELEIKKEDDAVAAAQKQAEENKVKSKEKLIKAYDSAIRKITQAGDIEGANALLAEKKKIQDGDESADGQDATPQNDKATVSFTLPKGIKWKPLDGKKQIESALMITDIIQGHDRNEFFEYVKKGNYDAEVFGKKTVSQKPSPEGVFTPEGAHGNSTYFIIYLNAKKETSFDLEIPHSSYGNVTGYLDFSEIGKGEKGFAKMTVTLTPGKHVLVVDYINTWDRRSIRFKFPKTSAMIGYK